MSELGVDIKQVLITIATIVYIFLYNRRSVCPSKNSVNWPKGPKPKAGTLACAGRKTGLHASIFNLSYYLVYEKNSFQVLKLF